MNTLVTLPFKILAIGAIAGIILLSVIRKNELYRNATLSAESSDLPINIEVYETGEFVKQLEKLKKKNIKKYTKVATQMAEINKNPYVFSNKRPKGNPRKIPLLKILALVESILGNLPNSIYTANIQKNDRIAYMMMPNFITNAQASAILKKQAESGNIVDGTLVFLTTGSHKDIWGIDN